MGSISNDQLQESTSNIPLIDFALFLSTTSTETERLTTAKELVTACRDVGFVSIANHGVPSALLSEAFEWSKRLFDLGMEEKMLAPHPDGPAVHRGYSYPGLEKVSQIISDDLDLGKKLREVRDCKVCLPALVTSVC